MPMFPLMIGALVALFCVLVVLSIRARARRPEAQPPETFLQAQARLSAELAALSKEVGVAMTPAFERAAASLQRFAAAFHKGDT